MTDPTLPHHPINCTVDVLNFYADLSPGWESILDDILDRANISDDLKNITELLVTLGELSSQDCQKELYDLPFFYVGA